MFACFDEGCREEGEGEAFGLFFTALGMGLLICNFCLPDVEGFFKACGVPVDMGWTCTAAFGCMYTADEVTIKLSTHIIVSVKEESSVGSHGLVNYTVSFSFAFCKPSKLQLLFAAD